MAVDNADLIKRLEEARKDVEMMGCFGYNDSDGIASIQIHDKLTTVIEDLKLMTDDGK